MFFSISGKFRLFLEQISCKIIFQKASGELLDPDHYTRARNHPPIPPQAFGKIVLY